jgi:hypothetical protein
MKPFVIKSPFASAGDIKEALGLTRKEVHSVDRLVEKVLGLSDRRARARPVRRAAPKKSAKKAFEKSGSKKIRA